MKDENNIRVELVRMEGDVAPFVQVNYVGKDGQGLTGLLLLDSGSNENILSPDVADSIGPLSTIEDSTKHITSISQEVMVAKQVRFSFVLGDSRFDETFCLSNEPLQIPVKGMTVIGFLGNVFMQQQSLVIDYSDYTLHSSEISPDNFSISDCAFFFPMKAGLKIYGIPVVPIMQNGVELVTLVDTGATSNLIANQALTDYEFKCERMEGKDAIMGVQGRVDAEDAMVWFTLLLLNGDDSVAELSCCAYFKVLPHSILTLPEDACDESGRKFPSIEILIGAPFMARQGWILDFGAKIIYKRKVAE